MPLSILTFLWQIGWYGSRYFIYWLNAVDEHSLQPPFIYRLYQQVIKPRTYQPVFEKIENERNKYLKDKEYIYCQSPGAPSKVNTSSYRKIKEIARHSLIPVKYGQLLYSLVRWKQPNTILELGTSLGISTLYLHEGHAKAHLYTMEGCPETARIAGKLFQNWKTNSIHLITGNINHELPALTRQLESVDFVFMDANHRLDPTLQYFHLIWPKLNEEGILVLDDIHWSPEMENAWEQIKSVPGVNLSIDLFKMGILVKKTGLKPQHYVLSF